MLHRRSPSLLAPTLLFTSLVCMGSTSVLAQNTALKPPQQVPLDTKDNWRLAATYYESPEGKESPVVILLHGERGNRQIWDEFAKILQKEGIAVVAVDLRKHGESQPPSVPGRPARSTGRLTANDYAGMVLGDLPAVKKFIFEQHQEEKLNMRKTGIVASDMSAPLAIEFALRDWLAKPHRDAPTLAASTPRGQDVRAIALLSPDDNAGKVAAKRSLVDLRSPRFNVAFFFAKGADDTKDRRTTDDMHELATKAGGDARERVEMQEYKTRFRGTELLGRGRSIPIEFHLLEFFKKHLKDLDDPWVDREPRI